MNRSRGECTQPKTATLAYSAKMPDTKPTGVVGPGVWVPCPRFPLFIFFLLCFPGNRTVIVSSAPGEGQDVYSRCLELRRSSLTLHQSVPASFLTYDGTSLCLLGDLFADVNTRILYEPADFNR